MNKANKMIDECNTLIEENNERISILTRRIREMERNHNVDDAVTLDKAKNLRRKCKRSNRRLYETRNTIASIIADCKIVDESTMDAVSNKPVTRDFIKSNYIVTDSFSNISLNSINEVLPCKLSSKSLHKIIVETFPDVEYRRVTSDVKYNLKWR